MRTVTRTWGLAGLALAVSAFTLSAVAEDRKNEARGDGKSSQAEDKTIRSGELMSMADGQIVLKNREGQEQTFKVADSAKVTLNDKNGTLKDLHKGDRIRATIGEGDVVMAIAATRAEKGSNATAAVSQSEGQPAAPPTEGLPQDPGLQGDRAARQGPTLGVRLGPSPTTGLLIREVRPQSPAATAGLRTGDYILTINGDRITAPTDIEQALAGVETGGSAKLAIWRNGQRQEMTVSFTEQRQAGFRGEDSQAGNRGEDRNNAADRNDKGDRNDQGDRTARDDRRDQDRGDRREGRGWLGVMVVEGGSQPGQPQQNQNQGQRDQRGVLVRGIFPNGPAARAGFRAGDFIVKINGEDVGSPQDVINTIQQLEPGKQVEFVVTRGDGTETLKPTIVDRQQFSNPNQAGNTNPNAGQNTFGNQDQTRTVRGAASDSGNATSNLAQMQEEHRRLQEQNRQLQERLNQVTRELQDLRKQLGVKESDSPKSEKKNND